uniref:Uncharacterized protein n=1 Tax=Anguilla anguilla TaxID=7936 RepID=A0A0E9SPB2_ANGAN
MSLAAPCRDTASPGYSFCQICHIGSYKKNTSGFWLKSSPKKEDPDRQVVKTYISCLFLASEGLYRKRISDLL